MLFRFFSYITLGEDSLKIDKLGEQKFSIFINALYISDVKYVKEEIMIFVKNILVKIKSRLALRGFYKVKVYPHHKLGIFLELVQLEVLDYDYSLDFRILVYLDEKIYFKTKDYFILPNTDIYYLGEYYYCNIDSIPKIEDVVEFGDFIYGNELYSTMFHWKKC